MPRDPLRGLFDEEKEGKGSQIEVIKKRDFDACAYFEERPDGYVIPRRFDNDQAIEDYEDALQDLVQNAGLRNEGVAAVADGLSVLYDVKAGIDKNAKYYDKAIEYINLMQQSLMETYGKMAAFHPRYTDGERRKAKIERKKERRLAKQKGKVG